MTRGVEIQCARIIMVARCYIYIYIYLDKYVSFDYRTKSLCSKLNRSLFCIISVSPSATIVYVEILVLSILLCLWWYKFLRSYTKTKSMESTV
jgi:hypothetical protein